MSTREAIRIASKDLILPELETLSRGTEELKPRLDMTSKRLDRLYEVIVRREEHEDLARMVLDLQKR